MAVELLEVYGKPILKMPDTLVAKTEPRDTFTLCIK